MKRALLILVTAVFLGLLYIYQQVEPVRISYEIRRNKKILSELKEKNRLLKYKLTLLASPVNLEREMDRKNIELRFGANPKIVALNVGLKQNRKQMANIKERYFMKEFLESLFSREAEAEQK